MFDRFYKLINEKKYNVISIVLNQQKHFVKAKALTPKNQLVKISMDCSSTESFTVEVLPTITNMRRSTFNSELSSLQKHIKKANLQVVGLVLATIEHVGAAYVISEKESNPKFIIYNSTNNSWV